MDNNTKYLAKSLYPDLTLSLGARRVKFRVKSLVDWAVGSAGQSNRQTPMYITFRKEHLLGAFPEFEDGPMKPLLMLARVIKKSMASRGYKWQQSNGVEWITCGRT